MRTLILLGSLLALLFTGCEDHSPVDRDQEAKTEQLMSEANKQIGLPKIQNFNERKLATLIIEMRDKENLPTYTYLWNERTGQLVFLFHSIGFGLPYGTQVTNPMKIFGGSSSYAPMPQAEPNGLFMPPTADATWVLMATKSGPRPVYVEPRVIISPEPLTTGGKP